MISNHSIIIRTRLLVGSQPEIYSKTASVSKTQRGVMSTKLDWIHQELNSLKEAGLYNRIRTLGSPQGAWLIVDGKSVLNFCSNNYLGLANHPKLIEAAQEIVTRYGVGPGAVRSIAGTMD